MAADTRSFYHHQCGMGRFHWMLLAACGMGLAADTAELLVLGFVLPSAEVDFCISPTEKRVLGTDNDMTSYRPFDLMDFSSV